MASICDSCRFGYPEPNDDGYYCEAVDEVFKQRSRCGRWACKLSKIGTDQEYEHNAHYDSEGNWHPTDKDGNWIEKKGADEMSASKKQQVMNDAKTIEKTMQKYSGTSGCHFGFIACETGERQFIFGGRVDMLGGCLAQAISMMIEMTPGINEKQYLNAIAGTTLEMLKERRQKGGRAQ